jgi:ribosomal protein S18 acetylase RimI-like enzyme
VSEAIQAVVALAYEQEAHLLGVAGNLPPSSTPEEIQSSPDFYLGAFTESELVGVLSIGPDDEPQQLSINLLVVHPSKQRRSIGTLLLREALARGKNMPFAVAVASSNRPALALYTKLGFAPYREGVIGPNKLPLLKLKSAA